MDRTLTIEASDEDTRGAGVSIAHYLVVALDCARPLAPPVRLQLDTDRVTLRRGTRREWRRSRVGETWTLDVQLPDAWMSSEHARLVRDRTAARWVLEDDSSKNGTLVNGERVGRAELEDGDVIELGNTLLVYRELDQCGPATDDEAHPRTDADLAPRTLNPEWMDELGKGLELAPSRMPLLLVGETGTGKEVLARAIHAASGRTGPFVAINCGAIAQGLVESELFGAKKGSFSGALEDRLGLIRAAQGGTLFLDEVAELPESSQVALLRVLQEHEVLPVGATRAVPVDFRLIAATNVDLEARVQRGEYRRDLYARLAGHVVRVPPLRSRVEDLGVLIAELLPTLAPGSAERITFSRPAARALFSHDWPFNVRELEHALGVAVAVETNEPIALERLPEKISDPRSAVGPELRLLRSSEDDQGEGNIERERILAALNACAGNQTHAARKLGISRATLVKKIAIHRLPRPRKPHT